MKQEKVSEILRALNGLKYHEWSKVKMCIEKKYASMACKLELNDTEALQKEMDLEFIP